MVTGAARPGAADGYHRRLPGRLSEGPGQRGEAAIADEGPLGSLAGDLAIASLALARRFAAGATMWCWAPAWPAPRAARGRRVRPPGHRRQARPSRRRGRRLRSGRRPAHPGRRGDVLLAVATADDRDVLSAMRRAPAWGVRHRLDRLRSAPAAGRRRPRPVARRRRWRRGLQRRVRAALPPAVGADPRLLRAPGPARRGSQPQCDEERVHHLLRRGARRRGRRDGGPGAVHGAHRGRRRGASTPPWSSRRRPGDLCSSTPALALLEAERPVARGTDFLYPFIEGDERDPGALLADLAASAEAKATGAGASRTPRSSACGRRTGAGRRGDGRAVRGRRTALRLRQRRQRHRRGRPGRALPPPPAGRALPARSLVADQAVAHRARQRCRLRVGVLPPADRLRPAGDIAVGSVHQRQLGQPAPRLRRGAAAGSVHRRPGRLRRRPDGRCRARPLPGGRAPTACTASRRPRRRWSSSCGRRSRRILDSAMTDPSQQGDQTRPTGRSGRRRSSTGSRASAAGARGSTMSSSPWPTAPGARRRPP